MLKGIVLSGGSGTRLYPMTMVTSKQLLPVYDKPMIYYPLSVLMMARIREILIISTPHDLPDFKRLLGDGSRLGVKFSYAEQEKPYGLAHSFLLAEDFLGIDECAMILGDNIFHGNGMKKYLNAAVKSRGKATIFGYHVDDPKRFGIVAFDNKGKITSLEEKPKIPKSNYAVTGLYFYDNNVCRYAKTLTPSKRGELEITDLNNIYLREDKLNVITLGRGCGWFDTGTVSSLFEASEYVKAVETCHGLQIACLEEISYQNGWISKDMLLKSAEIYGSSLYGSHLKNVALGKIIY